jgi:hypothetical protein
MRKIIGWLFEEDCYLLNWEAVAIITTIVTVAGFAGWALGRLLISATC